MSAPVLLQIDFDYAGPWGADLAAAATAGGLAADIAAEPGLLWKIWTENRDEGVAGGWYVFAERAQAEAYLPRLRQTRYEGVTGTIAFDSQGELQSPRVTLYGYDSGERKELVISGH